MMNRDLPAPIVSRANRDSGGRVKLMGNVQTGHVPAKRSGEATANSS